MLGGNILRCNRAAFVHADWKIKLEMAVRQTCLIDMGGELVSSLWSNILYFLLPDRLSLHFFSGISNWRLGCCLLHHSPVSMSEDWCDRFRQWNRVPCGAAPLPSKLENCWFFEWQDNNQPCMKGKAVLTRAAAENWYLCGWRSKRIRNALLFFVHSNIQVSNLLSVWMVRGYSCQCFLLFTMVNGWLPQEKIAYIDNCEWSVILLCDTQL